MFMHFQLEMVTRETVVIRLFGELDHHAVEQIRAKISAYHFSGHCDNNYLEFRRVVLYG